jgi:predicted nucleotidyltransferase
MKQPGRAHVRKRQHYAARESSLTTDSKVRETIATVVDRIVEGCNPEKVVLFGSYAHGNPTQDSDLDILIVTEKGLSPEATYEIQRELSKRLSIPIQLLCVSEEEFRETKDVIGGITYPAAKYGEVLYEKS